MATSFGDELGDDFLTSWKPGKLAGLDLDDSPPRPMAKAGKKFDLSKFNMDLDLDGGLDGGFNKKLASFDIDLSGYTNKEPAESGAILPPSPRPSPRDNLVIDKDPEPGSKTKEVPELVEEPSDQQDLMEIEPAKDSFEMPKEIEKSSHSTLESREMPKTTLPLSPPVSRNPVRLLSPVSHKLKTVTQSKLGRSALRVPLNSNLNRLKVVSRVGNPGPLSPPAPREAKNREIDNIAAAEEHTEQTSSKVPEPDSTKEAEPEPIITSPPPSPRNDELPKPNLDAATGHDMVKWRSDSSSAPPPPPPLTEKLETEIVDRVDSYTEVLEKMCKMLKKRKEEANELLMRSIVANNKLLLLNSPVHDEKIQLLRRSVHELLRDETSKV